MKKILLASVFATFASFSAFAAPTLTIYYSPMCPHCHHARDFIAKDLIIEYPDLVVKQVNADTPAGSDAFLQAVQKCKLDSNGVPLVVIGDKCEQGFGGEDTPSLYRADINAMLSADQIAAAAANKKALDADPDTVRAKYADKTNAILNDTQPAAVKKNSESPMIVLYGLIGILVIALLFVMFGKKKKK